MLDAVSDDQTTGSTAIRAIMTDRASRSSSASRRLRTRVVVYDPDETSARRLAKSLVGMVSTIYWTTSTKKAKRMIVDKGRPCTRLELPGRRVDER